MPWLAGVGCGSGAGGGVFSSSGRGRIQPGSGGRPGLWNASIFVAIALWSTPDWSTIKSKQSQHSSIGAEASGWVTTARRRTSRSTPQLSHLYIRLSYVWMKMFAARHGGMLLWAAPPPSLLMP